jgi:hypothetical protein
MADLYRDINGNVIDLSKSPALSGAPPIFGPSTTSTKVTPESQRATPEDISQTATKAAPYVGRFTANALPFIGAAEGPLGVGAGSATANALRNQWPGIFGQPGTVPEQLMRTGEDLLFQSALPGVTEDIATTGIQNYFRNKMANLMATRAGSAMPSVRRGIYGGMAEKIQQSYLQPESQIIGTAARNAQQQAGVSYPPRLTAGEITTPGPMPELFNTPPLREPTSYNIAMGEEAVPSQQSIKAITDKALSGVNQVRNFRLATGEPDTIRHLAANEILTGSMKGGKLDSTSMLSQLTGKKEEIYKEAMLGHYDDFKNLAETLEKYKTNPMADSIMKYEKSKLILSGGAMAFGGPAGKMIGGFVLTDALLGKLMSNPQTAQMVIQALKTPITSPEGTILAKGLSNLVRAGGTVTTVPEK